MIRIDNGRRYLFQWDLGQRLLIEDYPAGTSVHMAIEAQDRLAIPQSEGEKTGAVAFAVETYEEHGQSFADIPNILLQSAGLLHVYVYTSVGEEAHTDLSTHFSVVAREMPQCYEDDFDYSSHNSKLTALIARIEQKLENGELNGKDGADGKNGASAYEIAVEHGFEGDEEAWLESLKGERGAPAADYYLPGDANGDGVVDDKDPLRIQQYLNGWDVEINLACADVDGDGIVTMDDATRINQYLAGEDVELLPSSLAHQKLPTVTADDNGKLMQVVDGKWAALSLADSAIAAYIDNYISEALGGDY